tara:strand:- start:1336 stop:2907 length:1572 start_codon:yes stop_codon:yes gene_type:complete
MTRAIRDIDNRVPKDTDEFKACLADPWWRLTSGQLYKIMIKGDDGETELVKPFIPNEPQLDLLANLHTRNDILKARQLGFTTLIEIFFLDCCLFKANVRAAVIAQSEDVAKTIFRDKVCFAYDNLPPSLKAAMPLSRDSASELLFAHNNSSIRVATSARSGTLQYLHISEFGKICAKFPDRADEVITGSIPAVPTNGMVFIESTAEGQDGHFYKISKRAEALMQSNKKLNPKDYKFHFYPWHGESKYITSPEDVVITSKDNEYFDRIEVEAGCVISIEQRAWWVMTRDSEFSGEEEKMWQEYPSTPKEAFQKSKEGCYYTVQMTKARKQGRITTVPYKEGCVVNTFWDIGNSDGTGIWLHQKVGQKDHFIKYIEGWGEPYNYFIKELNKLDYIWGTHYLPHDGNHERQGETSNISPKASLKKLGLKNIEIVPRVSEISHGIQATRDSFSTCWIDEEGCKEGVIHLDSYRKKINKTTGAFTDMPVHDIHSESADAFRQFGQMNISGKLDPRQWKKLNYKASGIV